MWVLKQLWFYCFLAAAILIFIGVITGAVYYKTKTPLWAWILINIGVGIAIIGFIIMLFQLSIDRKRLECKMNH